MQADAEIVGAVLGGDREAFAALVSRYERAVWATAWRVLRDDHAAADAGAGGVSPGVSPACRPAPTGALRCLAAADRAPRIDPAGSETGVRSEQVARRGRRAIAAGPRGR